MGLRRILCAIPAAFLIATGPTVLAATPSASHTDPIPFVLDGGDIVVEVEIGSRGPLPFIVDTGLSDGNVLATPVAEALKIRTQGDLNYGDASGTGHPARRATVPSIRVGKIVLKDQPFAVTDIPPHPAPGGGTIAGVLGAPLLAASVVCIDYRKHVLSRTPRAEFESRGLTTMPMKLNHGLPTITAIIDGYPATVVVDSGFDSGIAVFPSFAQSTGVQERYPDLRVREGSGGSGSSFEILQGTADEVALSYTTSLPKVPMAIVPQTFPPAWGIDGLMGYAVLSRLDPCLDRDGGHLMWKPPS